MTISPLAGKPAPKEMLVDVARLEREYFERRPDLDDPEQRVSFGTSGHRGSSLRGSFTEAHILAISQAICDFRRMQGIDGPLLRLGIRTRFPGQPSTPPSKFSPEITCTPSSSRTTASRGQSSFTIVGEASGLPTALSSPPSHNPPEDGGFNYNPTHGGPADIDVTRWIEKRANDILRNRNGIQLPEGNLNDPAELDTVCGLGNRKNDLVNELIQRVGGWGLTREACDSSVSCV
jgi:phosphoglucomutase